MTPKHIVCLFDYGTNVNTGFATVSKNLVKELHYIFGEHLKFTIVAINYLGEPYTENNATVFSAIKCSDRYDEFGRNGLVDMLCSIDCDYVFIMQDLGIVVPCIPVLEQVKKKKAENNRKSFKSIFYFPVDQKLNEALTEGLDFFDMLVTYTEYGKQNVAAVRPELKPKIKVIPHGNNPKDFYPIADRNRVLLFRQKYFGEENSKKFIISNINRNQSRKDIPNTIFGFIEAKNDWDARLPEPFLYLHMAPNDPMGWKLDSMLKETDLVEGVDYMFPPKTYQNQGAGVSTMNEIYNASDVFITTTLGEGWGLTVTQAFACKLPVIAPMHTSLKEISRSGDFVIALDNLIPSCNMTDNVIRQQTDYIEVADSIRVAASSSHNGIITKKADRAYEYIKNLSWENVAKIWADYIKRL